jgi:hypothetical protein
MWVCIGHSHAQALAQGAEIGKVALDTINFWLSGEPWQHDEAGTRLRPDLALRIGQGRLVLSVLGGSAHTVLGQVEHPRPFDFVLPSEPDLPIDERRELVPAEAVRAKLTEMAMEYLQNLPALSRAATAPIVQIEPPPPLADADRIAPRVPWGLFPGQPRVIAPKWLRYKLWRLHSEVIAGICAGHGILYQRVPDSAKDAEGFLDPRFDADGSHANGDYGALVLDEMRRAA